VLYEVLTGALPYGHAPRVPLPARLAPIVEKLMAREPSARPAGAAELRLALELLR
jgi:hypothetical protein